jgi:hypothetical protein
MLIVPRQIGMASIRKELATRLRAGIQKNLVMFQAEKEFVSFYDNKTASRTHVSRSVSTSTTLSSSNIAGKLLNTLPPSRGEFEKE